MASSWHWSAPGRSRWRRRRARDHGWRWPGRSSPVGWTHCRRSPLPNRGSSGRRATRGCGRPEPSAGVPSSSSSGSEPFRRPSCGNCPTAAERGAGGTAPVGARDQVCVDTNGVVVSAAVDQSGPAAGTARPGETSTSAPTREIGLTFAPLDGADTDVHQRSLEVARLPIPRGSCARATGRRSSRRPKWCGSRTATATTRSTERGRPGSPADDLAFRLVGWSPTSPIVTVADSGAGQIELTAASTDGPVGDSVTRLQDDETLRSAAFDRASETFLGVVSEPVPGHGPDRTAAIISMTAGG